MFLISLAILAIVAQDCSSQDEDGPYRGKFIGKLNSYHHQVSGDVYAVDEWTILLVNFNYDGTGDDTFFWAGDSGRPGPQGFIVPDQHGKTNVLERYFDEEVRLTLPEGKRVSRIKWFSIYDLATQNAFGDVYVADEFEAPTARSLGPFAGTDAVFSQSIKVLDAKTLLVPGFKYDGSGEEVYFWCGVGPQPSSKGSKIPDEYGYLEPIGAYNTSDIQLELPGDTTVFDINWISIYDVSRKQSLGSVLVPEGLNVPPALLNTDNYISTLPHCRQLHRSLQVSWEVFGNQITLQLAGQIGDEDYMAFGISGSQTRSQMMAADVAVVYYDKKLQRAFATDYNITALAPCVQVLGQWQGVCRDDRLNYQDSNQMFTASRDSGLTVVTYRRGLQPVESIDREWVVDVPIYVVWAVGMLDHEKEPAFHHLYPKRDVKLNLGVNPPENDCFPFTSGNRAALPVWETAELFDPSLRTFTATLGPAGGRRGYGGRGGPVPPVVWYVNGQMAPDLQMRRGLQYSFKVFGGNDPHSATQYHPLVITTEPIGGLERLSEAAQRSVRVLSGVHYTRRGRLTPTAAGPLCLATHAPGSDRRRDDDYPTFRSYNRSLTWSCATGPPAELALAPNTSWPDVVYYHSFTHAGMGGRIHIVDRHKRSIGKKNAAQTTQATVSVILTVVFTYFCL